MGLFIKLSLRITKLTAFKSNIATKFGNTGFQRSFLWFFLVCLFFFCRRLKQLHLVGYKVIFDIASPYRNNVGGSLIESYFVTCFVRFSFAKEHSFLFIYASINSYGSLILSKFNNGVYLGEEGRGTTAMGTHLLKFLFYIFSVVAILNLVPSSNLQQLFLLEWNSKVLFQLWCCSAQSSCSKRAQFFEMEALSFWRTNFGAQNRQQNKPEAIFQPSSWYFRPLSLRCLRLLFQTAAIFGAEDCTQVDFVKSPEQSTVNSNTDRNTPDDLLNRLKWTIQKWNRCQRLVGLRLVKKKKKGHGTIGKRWNFSVFKPA